MKIKFLKECWAPQKVTRTFCECCGPTPCGEEEILFFKDEEAIADEIWHEINLSSLKFNEDYIITEYP